jgi:hypothetical protein
MNASEHDGKLASIWLDPSWLSWKDNGPWWELLDKKKAERPYEIHGHACNRLAHGTNELDRVDVITTLRRAVAQRVKVLRDVYGLRKLPIPNKPKGDFELLAYLGLVRPLMLRRLIDIRNIVEHEDSDPPTSEDCEIFADFVWYFLRSTDVLVRWRLFDFGVLPEEAGRVRQASDQEVRIYYDDPPNGPLCIEAFLYQDGFAYEPRLDWIEILQTKGTIPRRHDKTDDLTLIQGEFAPGSQMKLIWTWYFTRSFEAQGALSYNA